MTRNDIISGLQTDRETLAQYEQYRIALSNNEQVPNLTLAGCDAVIAGLRLCIASKEHLLTGKKMKYSELFKEITEYLRTDSIELESEQASLVGTVMGQAIQITKDSIHVGPISYFGAENFARETPEDCEKIRKVCELAFESWSRMLASRLEHARTVIVQPNRDL